MSEWPADLNNLRRQYGNFRPDKFAKNAGRQPWLKRREQREGNSNQHLFLVRQLPCLLCGAKAPSDPHHLRHGIALKHRGVGMKSPDRFCVPLCRSCHDGVHALGSRRERGHFNEHGYEALAVADALWINSGDVARMARVLLAHNLLASNAVLERRT